MGRVAGLTEQLIGAPASDGDRGWYQRKESSSAPSSSVSLDMSMGSTGGRVWGCACGNKTWEDWPWVVGAEQEHPPGSN